MRKIDSDSAENALPPEEPLPDAVDLRELTSRVLKGLHQILGFGLMFTVVALAAYLMVSRTRPVSTSTRVTFAFAGFERGQYPDKSNFQADDIVAPAIVLRAMERTGLPNNSTLQASIRSALNVEGIVPTNVTKERDRLRVLGQPVPKYVPDEYVLSLTVPTNSELSREQRSQFLSELVGAYREQFRRSYGQAPVAFGTAFETLRTADYPEYELVFNTEMDQIRGYLTQQLEAAKSFRSPTTNMSFQDLLEQSNLFAQIQLNEVLGLIHENGLSRNRLTAKMKMNYYLRQLEEQEKRAIEEEKVVRDLLEQAQARGQNVVLGIKSQAAQPKSETAVLDQGLIDSILQNDAYNLLVRRTLDAGMKVKQIQAEKSRLLDLRDNLISFIQSEQTAKAEVTAQMDRSLKALEENYNKLIDNIRKTQADYAKQQYADAVRLSDSIRTPGVLKPMALAGIVGGFLGLCFGAGLSLLGFYVGKRSPEESASAT
jgi:hypothetical protein